MKPLSALYYIKENKGRSFIIIFMLLLTTFLFIGGNFINSVYYFWDKAMIYSDKLCTVSGVSTDEDYSDFTSFYEDIKKDDNLIVMPRSARGYGGLTWMSTIGFEMGSVSYVFDTPEDLKTAFEELGISCDYSDIKDKSVVMSSALAVQHNLKKGDIVDASVDDNISGKYTLDAIIDDDSFILFYVIHDEGYVVRANVIGKNMSGQDLRDYLQGILGDRKGKIEEPIRNEITRQFEPFALIFLAGIALISLILSVVVNSVITGQYIRRTYEFGVYRAIGLSKFEIFRKCASEILTMDIMACFIGAAIMIPLMFILNELIYIPSGKFLPYFSDLGMKGFLLANLMVVIPTIILKGRSMGKADVTEF